MQKTYWEKIRYRIVLQGFFFAAMLFIIALIKALCRAHTHTHTNINYMIPIKYLSNESKANIKNKTEC